MPRITETNSGNESKGTALGLAGDQFLFILVAIGLSITIFVLCNVYRVDGVIALVVSLLPIPAALLYLFTFLVRKPPAYQENLIQQWMGDTSISKKGRVENPYSKK